MGKILEKIPTKDLYYLKRVCAGSKSFSKRFLWKLDAKKHDYTTNSNCTLPELVAVMKRVRIDATNRPCPGA